MTLEATVKGILRRVDRFSPYPLLYPFVMSDKERALFDETVRESRHYLEFGLGGSTLRALQRSRAVITTVESNLEWIEEMRSYARLRLAESRRLRIVLVDIGPTGPWGHPRSAESHDGFADYSSSVFRSIDGKLIDVALVDGRFRVACALRTILECHENSGFRMLIHDFWDRPQYHAVLKYVETVGRADTMGLFAVKRPVDPAAVQQDYEAYKLNPE